MYIYTSIELYYTLYTIEYSHNNIDINIKCIKVYLFINNL